MQSPGAAMPLLDFRDACQLLVSLGVLSFLQLSTTDVHRFMTVNTLILCKLLNFQFQTAGFVYRWKSTHSDAKSIFYAALSKDFTRRGRITDAKENN